MHVDTIISRPPHKKMKISFNKMSTVTAGGS